MALQVKIKLCGMCDFMVNYCTGGTVARPVAITLILGEEPDVMSLPNYDHGDLRLYLEIETGPCSRS
jgi:hypothetical protein